MGFRPAVSQTQDSISASGRYRGATALPVGADWRGLDRLDGATRTAWAVPTLGVDTPGLLFAWTLPAAKEDPMRRYHVRVALGECWCFEVGDDLEVMHTDRLADIEATARARIATRDGVALDAFELVFDLLPTGAALRHLTG
jgi:hypothetical protein